MGILAAVAIPAYNRYRQSAAIGAFSATGTNIVRAFQACVAANSFAQCDSLNEIAITVDGNKKAGGVVPLFCADMEQEIGGEKFRGCYGINAASSAVSQTFNERTCFTDIVPGTPPLTNNCDTDRDGTNDAKTAAGFQGGDCETAGLPTTKCQADADCVAAGVGDLCSTAGTTGTCDATTGICG